MLRRVRCPPLPGGRGGIMGGSGGQGVPRSCGERWAPCPALLNRASWLEIVYFWGLNGPSCRKTHLEKVGGLAHLSNRFCGRRGPFRPQSWTISAPDEQLKVACADQIRFHLAQAFGPGSWGPDFCPPTLAFRPQTGQTRPRKSGPGTGTTVEQPEVPVGAFLVVGIVS